MIATMPEIPQNGRFTAMQTARILGVSRNTLLNYAKSGLIRYKVNKIGKRLYSGRDIQRCWRLWGTL
jgi:DNA-binding transcriptional MerR regulator